MMFYLVYFVALLFTFIGVMAYKQTASSKPSGDTKDVGDVESGDAREPDGDISHAIEKNGRVVETAEFKRFQRSFVAVYLIMMAADWMQGPFVYRLYEFYGYSRKDNGRLFIAGFGSSLVFGTWAGPLADRFGRKRMCIAYGILYILSCLTKHINIYSVLMVGRVLGGIATSILWSAFESWMVSEHLSRNFDRELLGSTFSIMTTGNGIVAILSGLVAQFAASYYNHPVAPFDVSALLLVVGSIMISAMWSENYGNTSLNVVAQMVESIAEVRRDMQVFLTGMQQSLFEAAMYTFVFLWTPALAEDPNPPFGLIFACFMLATSIGGALFNTPSNAVPHLTPKLYLVAAASMLVPAFSTNVPMLIGAMIVFELVVGLFWPSIGTLRSVYIPEHSRATISNLFRVPLNFLVCVILYFQGSFTVSQVFTMCTVFHLLAAGFAMALSSTIKSRR